MATFFYGDPHSDFQPLNRAALKQEIGPADTFILLGDYDLVEPLSQAVAPVIATGATVRWIIGNHDVDDDFTFDFLMLDKPEWDLHARVHVTGSGLVVAGLGGVFGARIWYPKDIADAPAEHQSRAKFLRTLPKQRRWRGGLPLQQRAMIFPEDAELLSRQRADVLVCHEAPITSSYGFAALDKLTSDLRARWIVHGHHHTSYEAQLASGIWVRGLGIAKLWCLPAS